MKNSIKAWKIAACVAAGVLAAAAIIALIVRNIQQLRKLAREVRELCFRTEQEFGYGDACCYCGEEDELSKEEASAEDETPTGEEEAQDGASAQEDPEEIR